MRILVTGGAGYIGSVCSAMLAERGFDVTILDDLSKGHRMAAGDLDLMVCNLLDEKALSDAFGKGGFDAVIHFAGRSVVGESVADPEQYYRINVVGGLNLLSAMRSAGVKKIIFSSTAAVYGSPQTGVITEEHSTNPINPYGRTKLDFEGILECYRSAYGFGYVSLRYFNAAGAALGRGEDHNPETHLIPLALEAALGKRDYIEVFGDDYPTPDGTCIRDYIHVADLCEAHILALEDLEEQKGSIYNLGNGKGFSVREVIETASKVADVDIPAKPGVRRPGDPAVLVASSDKIKKELGWKPRHPNLEEIIASAWQWHKENPEGYGD